MAYFPLFLDVQNRPCLVIGGGQVAHRKIVALLACGARVAVVSPQISAGLKKLARGDKVRLKKRPFRPADLAGMELAVAATGDQQVNRLAVREARRRKVWINVVDQPKLCSFTLPSVVRRGKLTLAISTGGISPALSKWIRKDLETRYGPEFSRLLTKAPGFRKRVHERVRSPARRKRLLEKALKAYLRALELPAV